METILVTGGAGFIGSNIAEALLERGHSVVVLDDLSTGRMQNIEHHLENPAFTFYHGSILDSGLVKDIVQRHAVSRISHQAAVASVTKSIQDPVATSQVNIIGTINLFHIASEQGCKRIVFASSCAIYGDTKELPIRESITTNSKSPYAASKASNELLAGVFHGLYGTTIVGLRYFNVYGKRQDPASEYAAVVPRFITKALGNEDIPIEGDGNQTRDFIYINDVVQANLKALLKEDVSGGAVYNVACGQETSIVGLAKKIVELSGSNSKILHLPPRQGDVRNSHADIEKARKHLNYAPEYTIDSGLKNTISWYREDMNKTNSKTRESDMQARSSQLRPVSI
jgi:dTDP-glucose 4,6-dehydratase